MNDTCICSLIGCFPIPTPFPAKFPRSYSFSCQNAQILQCVRPNKKILSFPVRRPTHIKKLRPKNFYETFGPKTHHGPIYLTKNASRVHFSWTESTDGPLFLFCWYIFIQWKCQIKMNIRCVYINWSRCRIKKISIKKNYFPTDLPEKIS